MNELRRLVRSLCIVEGLSMHDHVASLIDMVRPRDVQDFKRGFGDRVDAAAKAAGWDRSLYDTLQDKAQAVLAALMAAAKAKDGGEPRDRVMAARERTLELARDFDQAATVTEGHDAGLGPLPLSVDELTDVIDKLELLADAAGVEGTTHFQGAWHALMTYLMRVDPAAARARYHMGEGVLRESTMRHCDFYLASDGKWYMELADEEYGEWEDATTYGPFPSEEAVDRYLSANFSNPGGMGIDDSGSREPPTKSPNGRPVVRPGRGGPIYGGGMGSWSSRGRGFGGGWY